MKKKIGFCFVHFNILFVFKAISLTNNEQKSVVVGLNLNNSNNSVFLGITDAK